MHGEKNGKPYFLMDDLGGRTTIFGNIHVIYGKLPYIELICIKPVRHTIPMDLL